MKLANHSAISLRELLPNAKFVGKSDILVSSCSGSWRECQNGDLFVAIVQADDDGHDHARQALDQGAVSVLCERLLAVDGPQCIVEDTRAAYSKICWALAGTPSTRATTIGVTGSQGKTVTAHLLDSILNQAGSPSGLLSSIESHMNCPSEMLETMSSPQLASCTNSMVTSGCQNVVVEVPSVWMAEKKLSGFDLDVAVITNIRREHLERHTTAENYVRTKWSMLETLSESGIAILNADDAETQKHLDKISVPALTFGVREPAEVRARLLERCKSEQCFLLMAGNESVPVRTSMIGDGMIYNCLAAAAAGFGLGIDLATIVNGIESVGHLQGRMERIECGQEFGVFVDTGYTPSQLRAALRSLQQTTDGKVFCVYSPPSLDNPSANHQLGKTADKYADASFITSPSVGDWQQEMFHQVIDGYKNPRSAHIIANRLTAIEYALEQANSQDTVLIAGVGEKPIATVGDHHWTITDRDVCENWLYGKAESESPQNPASHGNIFRIEDYRND